MSTSAASKNAVARPAVRIGNTVLFHGGQSVTLSVWARLMYRLGLRKTIHVPAWRPLWFHEQRRRGPHRSEAKSRPWAQDAF
jgi:hypothetical protein